MGWRSWQAISPILLGLLGLAAVCGDALGGVLTGLPAIYGPGRPQGAPEGVTLAPNNDNVGASNPNRISLVGIDILGLEPIDLSIPVANSPGGRGTTEYFIELGSAANQTDRAWEGFLIALGSGRGENFAPLSEQAIPGVTGLDFDTPDRDPVVTSPSFLSVTHDSDLLTFSGGIVQVGEVARAQNFSIDVPDTTISGSSSYDFTIRLQVMPVLGKEGDFDQDGSVYGTDLLFWQRDPNVGNLADWQMNYGKAPGDFDRDGNVDGADFLHWQRDRSRGSLADWQANVGHNTASTSRFAAVPEPSRMSLPVVAALVCVVAGRGRP